MNENNLTPTPTPSTTPAVPNMPEHHHKYWAILLVLMGITLAATMYFVYKNSTEQYGVARPEPMYEVTTQETTTMEEPAETSGSVELDQKMTTPNVTDDVLNEIEDVEKTDPSMSFDETQVNDLQ